MLSANQILLLLARERWRPFLHILTAANYCKVNRYFRKTNNSSTSSYCGISIHVLVYRRKRRCSQKRESDQALFSCSCVLLEVTSVASGGTRRAQVKWKKEYSMQVFYLFCNAFSGPPIYSYGTCLNSSKMRQNLGKNLNIWPILKEVDGILIC